MCTQNWIKYIQNCIDYFYTIYLDYKITSYKPKFTCSIITVDKIYEINNETIKYHNKIRYIYFPSSQFLEKYIFGKTGTVIIKILKIDNNNECNCEFNLKDQIYTENIINGVRVRELCLTYPTFSIILRCLPDNSTNFDKNKGYIILRYNRDNIELY